MSLPFTGRPPAASAPGLPVPFSGSVYVDENYSLRLNAWSMVAGVTLALRWRFRRGRDAQLVNSADQLVVTGDRLLSTTTKKLPAGFPVDVQVFVLAGTPLIGQCFVQVQIVGGDGPAAVVLGTLMQDYVSTSQSVAWPGSPIRSSTDGAGALIDLQTGILAAGVDPQFTVPTNARYEWLSMTGNIIVAGAAGNRYLTAIMANLLTRAIVSPTNINLAPGAVADVTFMAGFSGVIDQPSVTRQIAVGLPPKLIMRAGYTFGYFTIQLNAADQWGFVDAQVLHWIDI